MENAMAALAQARAMARGCWRSGAGGSEACGVVAWASYSGTGANGVRMVAWQAARCGCAAVEASVMA